MYKNNQLNTIKIIKKGYQKQLMKDIKVFLKKEEKRKQQYGQEQCKSLPGDEKQKLVEYIKQYYKMRKKYLIIIITSYFPFKFTSKS